jgi:tetratricopeptide (TPR) repeat protein
MEQLLKQGNALLELGKLEQAEAVFQDACSRWPDRPGAFMAYARVAELQGCWAEALERWQQVEEMFPNNTRTCIEQVNALIELEEFHRAEELCVLQQDKWPNNIRPFYLHDLILERRRRARDRSNVL